MTHTYSSRLLTFCLCYSLTGLMLTQWLDCSLVVSISQALSRSLTRSFACSFARICSFSSMLTRSHAHSLAYAHSLAFHFELIIMLSCYFLAHQSMEYLILFRLPGMENDPCIPSIDGSSMDPSIWIHLIHGSQTKKKFMAPVWCNDLAQILDHRFIPYSGRHSFG